MIAINLVHQIKMDGLNKTKKLQFKIQNFIRCQTFLRFRIQKFLRR
jgi:hypothetical protein